MTGLQYLTYIADIFDVDATTRQRRIGELAERLDLTAALGDRWAPTRTACAKSLCS